MKQVTPGLHLKRRKNKNCYHSLKYPLFIILRSLVHIIHFVSYIVDIYIYLKNVFVRTLFLFLFNIKKQHSSTTFTQAHTQVATPDDANKFFPFTNHEFIHNQSFTSISNFYTYLYSN